MTLTTTGGGGQPEKPKLGVLKADKSLRIIRSGIFPALETIRGRLIDHNARINALEKQSCDCRKGEDDS